MDQRQLERFVDVVESGSLSRTSRRLNVSQPALSKSLRLIEQQLGMKLLERGPRGVRVTKFGDVFYKRARTIIAQFRRTWEDLEDLKGSTAGQVVLGATPGPGVLDQIVPEAIWRVAANRPSLRFTVRSGSAKELMPALHQGEVDILFTVLDEHAKGPDLRVERLFEDHFVLVVNRQHPLLSKKRITLEDLTSRRWAFLQDASSLWHAIEDLAGQQQITPKAPMETNSVVFVRTIAAKTDVIGVLPSYAAEIGAESGALAFIPLERISDHSVLPQLARPMGVMHSAVSDLTPAGEALLRSIKAVCHELHLTRRKR
ncbi:MAG: LysR family transcriptional regulator [Legionella sp.]|nr:LysR family transcriptional regulator [Legionella sp.]